MKSIYLALILALIACGPNDKGGPAGLTSSDTATSGTIEQQKEAVIKEKNNGWEAELKFSVLDGCIEAVEEDVTYKIAAFYCECVVDYIVAHYEADYFVTHANSVAGTLQTNGTVKSCADKAKVKGG